MNTLLFIPDVQSSIDTRQLSIQRVGVKAIRYPITLCMTPGNMQSTVGIFNLDVQLPAEKKGAHMSRFVALLEEESAPLNLSNFRVMLSHMLEKLEANAGRIEVTFPYFIRKTAPVSGVYSLLDYQVTLSGRAHNRMQNSMQHIDLKVCVPVTSLCPCSKEIARYGAHNQRSQVTVRVELNAEVRIEELVRITEEEASCELWGLLKRPDEKFVTERAYDNPKFVEDLVRDIAVRLNQDDRIVAYIVEAENFESIHNHNAYALIEQDKRAIG